MQIAHAVEMELLATAEKNKNRDKQLEELKKGLC